MSTRKWRDEKSGQDKYSTEVVLQGFNSTLTMLGGKSGGQDNFSQIANDSALPEDSSDSSNQDLDDKIPF